MRAHKSSKYTTLNSPGGETHALSCSVSVLSLTGMNAAVWRLDQIINISAPLFMGQVMTWASHVIGCGFILGWSLVSLLVEFLFLFRVFQLVPQLAVKPQRQTGALPRKATGGCEHSRQCKLRDSSCFFFFPSFMSMLHFFFSELVSNYNLNVLSANVPQTVRSEKAPIVPLVIQFIWLVSLVEAGGSAVYSYTDCTLHNSRGSIK